MPKQVNAFETTDPDRSDDGPEWSTNGVELIIAPEDREALQDFGIQHLLSAVEEVLHASSRLRRGEAPTDPGPQRSLSAITHVIRWMEGAQREMLVSGFLTHGQAAAAMGIPRPTAQKRRAAAHAAEIANQGLDAYQSDVSHRPDGTSPEEWYGRQDAAEAPIPPLSVLVPGGDLPVEIKQDDDGKRSIRTQARVLIVNGERLVIRAGERREAQGFRWYGSDYGIEGYENYEAFED